MGAAPARRLWLDWQRGLAVLFMVEWHTYDSWRADAVAQGPGHNLLGVVGGFAAPSFLYMAGLSQVLADAAAARKGVPAGVRRRKALGRALWLLGVAYLFRFVEYLLGGAYRVPGGWEGILKVDVLNVIAVSLLFTALLTVGFSRGTHLALVVGAAVAVAVLSPVVAGWHRPESRLLDYLYGDYPRAGFHLFPWMAFALAGSAAGRLSLAGARASTWILLGAALFAAGWVGDSLPAFYAHQDFWRVSPNWLAMRLGMVVVMSGLLQLLPDAADGALSWLRTLGRHSLLGYFLSVELPYGAFSAPLHRRLSMGQAIAAVLAMVVLTWAASAAADRFDDWKARRARARLAPAPA